MRLFLSTICIFALALVIKIDLEEGTIPLASFYEETCEETYQYENINVRVAANDTIYSLFATTPSPVAIPFPERLTAFYDINPHLQKQALVAGERILIPIKVKANNQCQK
ncbi:hypothetical protein [Lysinibacillus sp. 54212]|uniref:hypothetical protein n=1 Tax=Lysinibacillus sp. 54212 TaxID=3119829 RepID=UPI002FC7727F